VPKRFEVSPEQAQRWVELHRRGWNYSRIEREDRVPRRVVSRVIRQHEEAQRLQEAAGARRDVAAGYLREHFQMLEVGGGFLLQLVAPPSIRGTLAPQFPELEVALPGRLKDWLMGRRGYNVFLPDSDKSLAELGQPEHQQRLDERAAEQQSQAILEGLKEHLPGLWPFVKRLTFTANEYRLDWKRLRDKCVTPGSSPSSADAAIETAVKLIRKEAQPKTGVKGVPRNVREREPTEIANTAQRLLQIAPIQQQLEELARELSEWQKLFEQLDEMLGTHRLRRTLVTTRCQFCPVP